MGGLVGPGGEGVPGLSWARHSVSVLVTVSDMLGVRVVEKRALGMGMGLWRRAGRRVEVKVEWKGGRRVRMRVDIRTVRMEDVAWGDDVRAIWNLLTPLAMLGSRRGSGDDVMEESEPSRYPSGGLDGQQLDRSSKSRSFSHLQSHGSESDGDPVWITAPNTTAIVFPLPA